MIDLLIPLSITDYLDAAWFFNWFVENADYLFVFIFMMIESSRPKWLCHLRHTLPYSRAT